MTPPSSESDGLRVTTLGALAAFVTSPAGLRQLGRSKPVALLAYLTAAPGRRASRERLASLLWSEGSSEQARQNLRQTIWYIRRRLGAVIHGEDDTVAIEGDVVCDRFEFLRAVREHRLADAVELYAGDFIPEFAAPGAAEFEEWADVERRRLRGMFVACCDTLAREALTAGQFSQAVALARRARDVAPMDLASWRLLLEALAAARDQLGCVAELESLDAQLAAEELVPDANLRAAIRAAREVGRRESPLGGHGASGSDDGNGSRGDAVRGVSDEFTPYAPDLIGREQEFRSLLGRWEGALQGRGGAVLVTGVAGLGKSRLLMDLYARLRASRAQALFIRANLGDRAVGGGFLAAVAEALAQRPGAAAVSSESAGVLVALAPSLASVFTVARADAAEGANAERRRVSALLDLLRAVSDERPLALLVDDIHWADDESRRVLDAVTARVESGRVLLVLSARPPVETLGGFAALQRIELQHFDAARVAEFVSRVGPLPADGWAAELPVHLLGASRGLPLTLIELLQRLVDTGALALTDTGWTSTAPRRIGEVLREGMVLEARVRSLGPAAREALLLLATLGRPAGLDAVVRVTGARVPDDVAVVAGPGDAADGGLVELEHRGFITRADGQVAVVHDEIGAAALSTATVEERRAAHARAARVLADGPDAERILMVAAAHAVAADDRPSIRAIARRWVAFQRRDGRDAHASVLLDRLFGANAPRGLAREVLRDIPWARRPARRTWQGIAVVALLVAIGAGWQAVSATRTPDLDIWFRLSDGSGAYARVIVPDLTEWQPGRPLEAERVDGSRVPPILQRGERASARTAPGGIGLVGQTDLPEYGGEVMVSPDGATSQLLAPHVGDDGSPSVSPDGRWVVWSSARWNPTNDRAKLALFDRHSGELRRLMDGPSIYTQPLWSPDGSRLAYQFNSFTEVQPLKTCVTTVDAVGQQCDWSGVTDAITPVGWIDDERLLVTGAISRLTYVLDVESGERRLLPGLVGAVATGEPRVIAGFVERGGQRTLALLRVDQSGAPRPIYWQGGSVDGELALVRWTPRPHYVDRVRVVVPADGVPIDQPFALLLEATDTAGTPMPARAVRFTSLDTGVAAVENGVLRPRQVGSARIVGTVGGWRSDTAEVRVVPSTYASVLNERWTPDWEQRWRGFGEPRPVLGRGDGGATINPNGDGKYPSGFYARRRIYSRQGMGLEARVSLPFTDLLQWQHLGIALLANSPNEPALRDWDHRTLSGSMRHLPVCNVPLGGEGGDGMSRVLIESGGEVKEWIPTPPRLFRGRWFTLRVQLFPDGRCGLAIDGRPLLLSKAPRALPDSVLPWISGHSFATNVQVGRMELWSGVKGGVTWVRMESPAP